jgi:TetR/AcrR family transcriptional repressor of nem operon
MSYNDISEAVGIKKASIHYHFQTKDVLGIEIIRRYRSKIEYLTDKLDNSGYDPILKLERYFEFFAKALRNDLICPGGVFSVEYNTLPLDIKEEVKNLFNFYISWLSDLLTEGRGSNLFHFTEKPKDKALYIASTIEGALILSRSFQITDHFSNVTDQVRNLLISKQ